MKNSSRMSNQEIIDVVKAHSEGKTIEYCPRGADKWVPVVRNSPVWDFGEYLYRVKKETRWANVYVENDDVWGYVYPSKEVADECATSARVACVEVVR